MAGIEQLEIHSKSYIVRWVKVDQDHTISWSVQPHKKSINFGIVKHPGATSSSILPNVAPTDDDSPLADVSETAKSGWGRRDSSTAQSLLASKGFIPIKWCGKCEADKVAMGTFDVEPGQGGMYGMVFDNTFSKQTSKTATVVLLTYPTDAPPQSNHSLTAVRGSQTSLGRYPPTINPTANDSNESLRSQAAYPAANRAEPPGASTTTTITTSPDYHVGILSKRRRRKGQGFARRYFSLDYTTCTLSYFHNRNSSALRGAIPLSLAAISTDEKNKSISIDSGAEVWHLRAGNVKEFTDWAQALEKASRLARGLESTQPSSSAAAAAAAAAAARKSRADFPSNLQEDREWHQVEVLVSRLSGTRDALRRLVLETPTPKPESGQQALGITYNISGGGGSTTTFDESDGYFPTSSEKRPFWRRKSSVQSSPSIPHSAHTSSQQSAITSPMLTVPVAGGTHSAPLTPSIHALASDRRLSRLGSTAEEGLMQQHCDILLKDLDSVVSEFTSLISISKKRRTPPTLLNSPESRLSIDSGSVEEFFDAEGGEMDSPIMKIDQSEDESHHSDGDSDGDSSSESSVAGDDGIDAEAGEKFYPTKPKSLVPLPIQETVQRRVVIPNAAALPPSLIGLVRKNVGKDLSTISMPVSTNEPLSMLQKSAEQLEYAQLLDQAVQQNDPHQRMLYVAAFAVSQFSSGRVRERAIRKPFNPLLGETFELVRGEGEVPGGFRLLVEKVCHRPVRLALQADSASWSISQSAAPGQKFWGKSAEITMDGKVRLSLRLQDGSDELYSWNIATVFLRNVVMGEKYVEPVGTMHVTNDTSGAKAAIEFRSKGMFGGRGEDVQVETFDADGVHTGHSLSGTWTEGLRIVDAGKAVGPEIWKVGALVDKAARKFGFTEFAVSLNEITALEKDKLPPTDSRLRPDQRFVENGDIDSAEKWKVDLEEAQRTRRRVLEESGEQYKPRWFTKVATTADGEEVWKVKMGKDSYWEERAKGSWSGVEDIFAV